MTESIRKLEKVHLLSSTNVSTTKAGKLLAGGPSVSRLRLFCKSFIRLCKHQFHNIASPTPEPHNYGGHPSPVPHAPRQLVTYFLSLWIHLLGLFYIVCDLLWLISFIQHVFRIHPCCRESFHSFLYVKYQSII